MLSTISITETFEITVDLDDPIDISIPLDFNQTNPSCYYAEGPVSEIIKAGDFIGSVKEGGSVNHRRVSMTPHGNGTHTEVYGHVHESAESVNSNLTQFNHLAQLISCEPKLMSNGDRIIGTEALEHIGTAPISALIIRTLPNDEKKLGSDYSGTNPPFLDKKLMQALVDRGINHLLIDLPSVDKEVDEGRLEAHKTFWRIEGEIRSNASITELIFVPDEVLDNLYFLQLCVPPFELDAAPSKPLIYSLV